MLIPIRKRTLETLVDEVGELQADIKALESALKKKKAALAIELAELGQTQAEGRRYTVKVVERRTSKVRWDAIAEVCGIEPEVIDAYTLESLTTYPLIRRRGDVK